MAAIGRPRRAGAVMFDEIARDYERTSGAAEVRHRGGGFQIGGHDSTYDLVHLRRFFARRRVRAIQPPLIVEYQLRRRAEGAPTQTINDEQDTLAFICQLAVKNGKLEEPPLFQLLQQDTPPAVRVEARSLHNAVDRLGRLVAKDMTKERGRQEREQRPAPPKTRGKLSPEALVEHIGRHPLDKRHADGTPFSVNDRCRALHNEQKITISRPRLTVRLNELK